MTACDEHLRRPWLLARLGSHLNRQRSRVGELLELDDCDLIAAIGGDRRGQIDQEYRSWSGLRAAGARSAAWDHRLCPICLCDSRYPERLRDLDSAPAVIHVAGEPGCLDRLGESEAVAIVGTRRPTEYGSGMAGSLGRSLAAAGLCVVSGMADGIDSSAHGGALTVARVTAPPGMQAATIAVLPGSASRAYPSGAATLHRRILEAGVAISELGPGANTLPWTFPARNRIIAALSTLTVVVEARERSGALVTAAQAQALGRSLGAVPGEVTNPAAAGPNRLLAEGAAIVRGAQDVLDIVYGAGARRAAADRRPRPTDVQARILAAVAAGSVTAGALTRTGFPESQVLTELAALELSGWIRRGSGGRFSVVP